MLPVFETERLLIRPRAMGDLEDCLAMDRDPAVTRYIPGPWADPAAHRAFVLARMATEYPDGLGYWSVLERHGDRSFLGWILLLPCEDFGNEVEIGWRFRRAAWGRGLATEAAAPVLAHALGTLGLDAVVADIDARNLASIRVAEKLGMRLAGNRLVAGAPARCYRIRRTPRSFP